MAVWSGSPSTFGSFHKVFLPIKNAPAPTIGTRTERTFLRYHLACRKIRPLIPVPTHRLPHNAGNASKDTQVSPFPLPSAAHLLPRFSLRSQLCETLCGCACNFTSASKVYGYQFVLLNYTFVRLSSTFFHIPWKWLLFPPDHDRIGKSLMVRAQLLALPLGELAKIEDF